MAIVLPQILKLLKVLPSPQTTATPLLKFDSGGSFKIVQFTDLHEGPSEDMRTTNLMRKILDYEKPNLVIITGDNIDDKCKSKEDVLKAITKLADPMENRNIPWAVTFGNHDDEHGFMNKRHMMEFFMSFKNNISKINKLPFNRIGNYNLLVQGSKSSSPALNIYLLDSGAYAPKCIGGYSWINCIQILWYRSVFEQLKKLYKRTIPALMFFHIPLPEFNDAWEKGLVDGGKGEKICCPKRNSGIFDTIVKAGDVKGIFVGHDHLNNFSAILDNIKVGYSGSAGYETYGSPTVPKLARVFIINEQNPQAFETFLRTEWDKVLNNTLSLFYYYFASLYIFTISALFSFTKLP